MGQASQADPSVRATIMPGEVADAAAASSLADLLVPVSTPAEAVADSSAELPVAADVGMAEAPLPVVLANLPVLGHEERAAVGAEAGDRRPATLAEERPSTTATMVPAASTTGDPTPWWRGAQNRGLSWGAATLSPRSSTPMSGAGSHFGSGASAPRSPSSSSTMSGRKVSE
jgi:hypothetical protein